MSKKKSKSDINILECVPSGYTPRAHQVYMLEQVASAWESNDVFVIDAPVAAGKSLLALTIALYSWKKYGAKAGVLAPNNLLVNQYKEDQPWLPTVGKQASYKCTKYTGQMQKTSCKREKQLTGGFCKGCSYIQDLRKVQAFPVSLSNYHSYVAYKSYRPTILFDEAHSLGNIISNSAARKFWHHDYQFPSWVQDYKTLYKWCVGLLEKAEKLPGSIDPKISITKLVALKLELESNKTRFIFSRGEARWRNEDRDCILASPVDISEEPPLFWPPKVKKLVMLSATFNSRDIKEYGLSNRKVYYVDCPSPIPKESRPFYCDPEISLAYSKQDANLSKLVEKIRYYLQKFPSKGFIHAPYALATKLRAHLVGEPRLIFHSTLDKGEKFREFKEGHNTVMVGSGMYEGISLDEDLARWQLVCKVPWPSLAEPAMEWLAREDSEYYASRTIKDLVQTYGRVCRGPDDYGVTICLDNSFMRLWRQYKYLMPSWFKEALVEDPNVFMEKAAGSGTEWGTPPPSTLPYATGHQP